MDWAENEATGYHAWSLPPSRLGSFSSVKCVTVPNDTVRTNEDSGLP